MSLDPRDQRIDKLEAAVDALLKRVDVLEVENRELQVVNAELRVENADLRVANGELRVENEELRARLDQNSNNSSMPPSSDRPGVPRPPKKPRTGRRPGGQPGHKKSERALLAVEDVDHVVELTPSRCGSCDGKRLRRASGAPRRHQQTELPQPRVEVTEYQCHAAHCLDCGALTEAEVPSGAAHVFGERLAPCVREVVASLEAEVTAGGDEAGTT